MTPPLKIVVEKHSDGYVAYPLGLARGVVVGQGDTYEAALSDVRSAIAFHVETFGAQHSHPRRTIPFSRRLSPRLLFPPDFTVAKFPVDAPDDRVLRAR